MDNDTDARDVVLPPPPPSISRRPVPIVADGIESVPKLQNPAPSVHSQRGSVVSSHSYTYGPQAQVATLSPPLGQFVINVILQIAGFAAAISFGVFAVKSVTVAIQSENLANAALEQALLANQVALINLCATGNGVSRAQSFPASISAHFRFFFFSMFVLR